MESHDTKEFQVNYEGRKINITAKHYLQHRYRKFFLTSPDIEFDDIFDVPSFFLQVHRFTYEATPIGIQDDKITSDIADKIREVFSEAFELD